MIYRSKRASTSALSIIASLALVVGMMSVPAQAAGALTNISVTVTTTQCPQGAKYGVKRVNASISTPGTSGSNWWGDTVTGLQAFPGNNEIIGSNFCQTGWSGAGYYWYWKVYRYFSFSGQRTYV
jgi:hypothetical protein